ncbi:MAG: GNAT family N-acetyltransferase [Methylococcales bacterium]
MPTDFHIRLFSSFAAAAEAWHDFESQADNYVFQSFDWLNTWYETVADKSAITPCITLVEYPKDQGLMLLPLAVQNRSGWLCLVWLGGQISDYHAPLLTPNGAQRLNQQLFSQLWQAIQRQLPKFDAICLEKQPEFIAKQRNPFTYLPCTANASNAHFTYLAGNLEQFLKNTISNNAIKSTRRSLRRIEDHGKVDFVIANQTEQIQALLATMIAQKSRSYQELGVANLFAGPGVTEFFQKMTLAYIGQLIQLSALTLNDRVLACHWGLVYKKRFYYLYPTYERDDLSKYSPGTLLLWQLFAWCMEQGIEVYDFTIGDEAYKDKWCSEQLQLYDFYQAVTVKGYLYLWPLTVLKKLKRSIKHQPTLWKTAQALRAKLAGLRKKPVV